MGSYSYAQNAPDKRPSVGIVLSGGGAKGFAHIGVLQVLAEKNIPVDMIGGTSIGSYVGGLLAAGYSPCEIEDLAESFDWQAIMSDEIPRDYVIFDERDSYSKYLVELTFDRHYMPQLPGGLIRGQNLEEMLQSHFWNCLTISDFNKLPIPFYCVAADIIKSKAVVLDKGYLPQAIRASIAVPTIFAPVKIDKMLLSDGGCYNNFPTAEMREKGADIVIGVNVGFAIDEIPDASKNMLDIANQILWTNNVEANAESRKLCDILIEPDTRGYSSTSFSSVEELVQIGRNAALAMEKELDSLALLLAVTETDSSPSHNEITKMAIGEYVISGLHNTSPQYFIHNMLLPLDVKISSNDINSGIMRCRGTMNYENISYKIRQIDSVNVLDINVAEKKPISVGVGVGYDTDMKTNFNIGLDVRNLFFKSTKLSADLLISRFPSISLTYLYFPNSKDVHRYTVFPSLGANVSLSMFQLFEYKERQRISEMQFFTFSEKLFFNVIFSRHFAFEVGLRNINGTGHYLVHAGEMPNFVENAVSAYTMLSKDRLNHAAYPTRGDKLNIKASFDVPYFCELPYNLGLSFNYSVVVPLGKKVFMSPAIDVFVNSSDTLWRSGKLYIGGMNGYKDMNSTSFAGYGLSEIVTNNTLVVALDFRWHVAKNHHLLFKSNFGIMTDRLFSTDEWQYKAGVGLGYSFDSFIGPLEIIVSNSILERGKPKIWVCLGYKI